MSRSLETIRLLDLFGEIKVFANTLVYLNDDTELRRQARDALVDVIEEIATKALEVGNVHD